MSVKQILCMKWGTYYGPEYVNILYGMVARNVTGDFRVICFTDDTTGIRKEVVCLPLPELGCEIPQRDARGRLLGKWPKVALWSKDLFGLRGVGLFVDLDSVIVANIDDYFSYGNENDVITARNWVQPLRRLGQTSVFRFPIGGHPYMLEILRANPAEVSCRFRFEQYYVTYNIRGGVRFWPPSWTKHFGVHCMGPWPVRYLRPPRLPKGVKIVTFPGRPKPRDAINGWSEKNPPRTPIEHIRWMLANRHTEKKWWRHITRYLQPSDWVREHWRE